MNKVEEVYIEQKPDEPTIIESICPNCMKNGETRMLLTNIPYFKEIVIMSFSCPNCHYKNNEIQPAASLEDYGKKLSLKVVRAEDIQRDIVKSNFASIVIPELGVEIPATGKGVLSTVEGFLTSFRDDLEMNQDYRKETSPDVFRQIEDFLLRLEKYIKADPEILPFTFVVDDPSGNSNIKNPYAPHMDRNMKEEKFERTRDQIIAMGYSPENVDCNGESDDTKNKQKAEEQDKKNKYTVEEEKELFNKASEFKRFDAHKMDFTKPFDENHMDLSQESVMIPTTCHVCFEEGETRMCTCEIPYFKELIIMAFTCSKCGARSCDVKTGGGISEKARKVTMKVDGRAELDRDIFKSETTEITQVELGFTVVSGSLGGIYTTVEGLLQKMLDTSRENPFVKGDSAEDDFKKKYNDILDRLEGFKDGKEPFTLILDDPLDNCFVQNPNYPAEDTKVKVEIYERTKEQDDELGISDMNTN